MAGVGLSCRLTGKTLFPMLDGGFDQAVERAGLREAHVQEAGHQRTLEAALAQEDLMAARAALSTWAPSFEAHLVDVEDVMMPLTERVAPTPAGRAAAVKAIMDVDWQGL